MYEEGFDTRSVRDQKDGTCSTETGRTVATRSRGKEMILTLKGLKLWGSGMIVLFMSFGFSMLMTEEYIGSMSNWEIVVVLFVLFPLALGAAQNWYWKRGETDDPVETL